MLARRASAAPQDAGLLASIGRASRVACVRRPRVRLVITGDELLAAGQSPAGAHRRQQLGGAARPRRAGRRRARCPSRSCPTCRSASARRWRASDADVCSFRAAARSAGGPRAAPRLRARQLDFHGISMRPSSPAGVGRRIGEAASSSCCRATRSAASAPTSSSRDRRCARSAGRARAWPHRRVTLPLARKIASEVGRTDYVRVAIEDGARGSARDLRRVDPLVDGARGGRVIVPRELEGMPEGAEVEVLLYDEEVVPPRLSRREAAAVPRVLDRDEAERRWRAVDRRTRALGAEEIALEDALGRVLAEDVRAEVDVPGFDRSNMDGFAVRAADTFGARRGGAGPAPAERRDPSPTGIAPSSRCWRRARRPRSRPAACCRAAPTRRARRAHRPRGRRPYGGRARAAGARGRRLLRRHRHGPRRDGALRRHAAHLARDRRAGGDRLRAVAVVRRPRVAILSTGDEIVQPGEAMRPGLVYDSNGRILADAVRELGGEPVFSAPSATTRWRRVAGGAARGARDADLVLLSGGTSKGEGDLNARVVGELEPGHRRPRRRAQAGQADLPGGPGRTPVVILPGFPTSARSSPSTSSWRRCCASSPGSAPSERETRARPPRDAGRVRARSARVPARRAGRSHLRASWPPIRWARAAAASRRSAAPTASCGSAQHRDRRSRRARSR